MDFSVVIPVHNDEDLVTVAARSALDQPLVSQVVLVDDGSTDATVERLREIDDPRLVTIEQSRQGPGAARNAGVRVATASHLVFLDSDDRLLPEAMLTFATGNEDADLIRTGAIIRRDHDEIALAEPSRHSFPRGAPLAGSFAIRRTLFDDIGGYDDILRFGENSELLLRATHRLHLAGKDAVFVGAATLICIRSDDEARAHYQPHRLAAAERMLEVHGDKLEGDRETVRNYSSIAAELRRQEGDRRAALRHGLRAIRASPTSGRSWARLALIVSGRARAPKLLAPASRSNR